MEINKPKIQSNCNDPTASDISLLGMHRQAKGHSKVNQIEMIVGRVDQYVVRFDVAMGDVFEMYVGQGAQDLCEKSTLGIWTKTSLLKASLKRTWHKWHHIPTQSILSCVKVNDGKNWRVVTIFNDWNLLIQGHCERFNLCCILPICFGTLDQEDRTISSLTFRIS